MRPGDARPAGQGKGERGRGGDQELQRLHAARWEGELHAALHRTRAGAGSRRTDHRTRGEEEMSRFEDPVIVTCSISGAVANREQCPAIPYTPEEYAAEARRIVDEGGSMIHIHARTPDGVPSYEVEDFRAITEAIKAEVGDRAIINYSTGA